MSNITSMRTSNQARILIKTELAARDLSVKALALQLGYARETVSRSIHKGSNPQLLARIRRKLGV